MLVQQQPRNGCLGISGATATVCLCTYGCCSRTRVDLQRLALRLSQMAVCGSQVEQ